MKIVITEEEAIDAYKKLNKIEENTLITIESMTTIFTGESVFGVPNNYEKIVQVPYKPLCSRHHNMNCDCIVTYTYKP